MGLDIYIHVPDGPDVVRALGEITHLATMYGSDVRVRRREERRTPIGDLAEVTQQTPSGEEPVIPEPPLLEEAAAGGGPKSRRR